MSLPPNYAGYYRIHLLAEDDDYPDIDQVSSFLYDFNLLYEFSRVIVDPEYSSYRFSRYSGFRNQKRIGEDDKLKLDLLSQGSPLELIALVTAIPAAAATLWALTQTAEKIRNWSLNREILELTRDRLLRDLQRSANIDLPAYEQNSTQFTQMVRLREAEENFSLVENRLQRSPLSVRELSITYESEISGEDEEQGHNEH
jgi:hypothetical protein